MTLLNEKDKQIRRIKDIIKGKHYTINYIEGYIDALFDVDFINDDEFTELNKLLGVRGH